MQSTQFRRSAALRSKSRRCVGGALMMACVCLLVLPPCFLPIKMGPTEAQTRRSLVAGGMLSTLAAFPGVSHAQFPSPQAGQLLPFVGKVLGPFEIDPKQAVILGDANSKEVVEARAVVKRRLEEAEKLREDLKKDDQTDVMWWTSPLAIAELRKVGNAINDIMDERTAPAVQRFERLMIQARYRFEDDAPFPETKKGEKRGRGPQRLKRMLLNLDEYIGYSQGLLELLPA
eukprot:TRINITY_DN40582_c0_g1_i1.p1 TRINITY_DN40582_c0_g1~~TRINITY_DN40582_c0_g1_i1.p1  ORF type:complete len:231 (+),score=42.17 TRINITY_DN40582_c0_g1_i1:116-808(+)